jgi:hypothetical protein
VGIPVLAGVSGLISLQYSARQRFKIYCYSDCLSFCRFGGAACAGTAAIFRTTFLELVAFTRLQKIRETVGPLFGMATPRKARLIEWREQVANGELVKGRRIRHC